MRQIGRESFTVKAEVAAALRIVADDESGEVEEAEILASFGRVPDDPPEQIRGG